MPAKNKVSIVTRIKAFVIFAVGIILLVLGIGMWQNPEVDWPGFIGAWNSLGIEFARLKEDPIALLGILVIIVGAIIAYLGIKRLVRGKS